MEPDNSLGSIASYVGVLRAGRFAILPKPGDLDKDNRIVGHFDPSAVLVPATGFEIRNPAEDALRHPDLARSLSSSGSSGTPELIRLSHRNIATNAVAIAGYPQIRADDRAITTLPPFCSHGMSVMNSHLEVGASLLLDARSVTDPDHWTRCAAKGATSVAGVSYMVEVLERSGFLRQLPAGLRCIAAADGKPASDQVLRFAEAVEGTGARFYVMYGQTEAAPRIAYLPPDAAGGHPGAIGRAIPGGELRSIDEDGQVMQQPGIVGELVYRGPDVMMGCAARREDLAWKDAGDCSPSSDVAAGS